MTHFSGLTTTLPLLFILGLLTACGFHLRGQTTVSSELKVLAIDSAYPAFTNKLLREFNQSGIEVTDAAAYHLKIITFNEVEELVSQITTDSQDVLLKVEVSYQLETANGLALFLPVEIATERYITKNKNQINASDSEKQWVFQELAQGLLSRIINKVASYSSQELQQEVERAREAKQRNEQVSSGVLSQ